MEPNPFEGVLDEIPCILVDHFVQVQSTSALFLSHCHADHMKGLNSLELLSYLKCNKDVFIYCSNITKAIISSWSNYMALSPFLKSLEINQNIKINLTKSDSTSETKSISELVVTLLPTGHCPGSVMFLFEGTFGTVLYSGDLRIAKSDCLKLKGLMNNPAKPEYGLKSIDHLYLDCTFCYPSAQTFPTRDETVEKVVLRIKEWASKGANYKVFFSLAGRGFGAEYVFVEIFKRLCMPTHVSQFKYNIYKNIPEICSAVSLDQRCRIHACEDNASITSRKSLQCTHANCKILTIRLTTQWHLIEGKNPDMQTIVEDCSVLRALYSMHSSLEELQDFVACLRPEKITSIAKPNGVSMEEMSRLLCFQVYPPANRIAYGRKRVNVLDSTSKRKKQVIVEIKP